MAASEELSAQQALNETNTSFTSVLVGEAKNNIASCSPDNNADDTLTAVENLMGIMNAWNESSHSSSGNHRYPDLGFEPISEETEPETEVPAIVPSDYNNDPLTDKFETPSLPELEQNLQNISESEGLITPAVTAAVEDDASRNELSIDQPHQFQQQQQQLLQSTIILDVSNINSLTPASVPSLLPSLIITPASSSNPNLVPLPSSYPFPATASIPSSLHTPISTPSTSSNPVSLLPSCSNPTPSFSLTPSIPAQSFEQISNLEEDQSPVTGGRNSPDLSNSVSLLPSCSNPTPSKIINDQTVVLLERLSPNALTHIEWKDSRTKSFEQIANSEEDHSPLIGGRDSPDLYLSTSGSDSDEDMEAPPDPYASPKVQSGEYTEKEIRHVLRNLTARDPISGKRWLNIEKNESFYNKLTEDTVLQGRSKESLQSFICGIYRKKQQLKRLMPNNDHWLRRLVTKRKIQKKTPMRGFIATRTLNKRKKEKKSIKSKK